MVQIQTFINYNFRGINLAFKSKKLVKSWKSLPLCSVRFFSQTEKSVFQVAIPSFESTLVECFSSLFLNHGLRGQSSRRKKNWNEKLSALFFGTEMKCCEMNFLFLRSRAFHFNPAYFLSSMTWISRESLHSKRCLVLVILVSFSDAREGLRAFFWEFNEAE